MMDPVLLRLLAVVAILVVAWGGGALWRRRDGRVRRVHGRMSRQQLANIGLDLRGAEAGAVLLSSETCSPCVTVRRILDELATERDSFRWVSLDAGEHLELARDHQVLRVPTLFVIDRGGRILARTSGVPARRDLERVLDHDGALVA